MKSRNVLLLALCQALCLAGPSAVVLMSGIVGADLAPNPALATLPISLGVVSTALASIPGALLMRRIGRRAGFILGALIAGAGALLAVAAITQRSFPLFCLAVFLIGQNSAFVLQYRFAATESVDASQSGRAVSLVLLGGILAGFIGPEVAKRSVSWLPTLYAGSFASLTILYAFAIVIMLFLQDMRPAKSISEIAGRPLGKIVRQPNYQVALLAGVASYGLMNFIMTATPVHMHSTGFSISDAAFVIQSHIIAMYLPSLVSGFLVERFGTVRIMQAGALLMMGCTVAGLLSVQLPGYWTALVLLGLGWNLLFVGGTVLLTTTYRLEERFKTQASNDFAIFAVQAAASFSAGSLLLSTGWANMNWLGLGIMAVAFAVILWRKDLITKPAGAAAVGQAVQSK